MNTILDDLTKKELAYARNREARGMRGYDRYLAINAWLQKRYRGKPVGRVDCKPDAIITWAGGEPTAYSRLDLAFFRRYALDCA